MNGIHSLLEIQVGPVLQLKPIKQSNACKCMPSLAQNPTIEQSYYFESIQQRALKKYMWFSNNGFEQLYILYNLLFLFERRVTVCKRFFSELC